MPQYRVTITDTIPCTVEATVVVEATSAKAAKALVRQRAKKDEVEWDDPEHDWDASEETNIEVEEVP